MIDSKRHRVGWMFRAKEDAEFAITYFTSEEVAQCAIEHVEKNRIIRYLLDIGSQNAINE